MADGHVEVTPLGLGPEVVASLRAAVPSVAERTVAALVEEVGEYGGALDPQLRRGIEQAVETTLTTFWVGATAPDQAGPATPVAPALEAAYALGRGEARGGRTSDALLAAYRVGARVAWREMSTTMIAHDVPGGRALGYLLILAVEELLDAANRATMKDERIHPVSRQIAKLHVMEEARHVSFAKTYLSEVWPTLAEEERAAVAGLAAIAVAGVADLTVNPAVYEELGIDGGDLAARANPHHQARVVEGFAKLAALLTELGMIDDDTRPTWQELGLVHDGS